MRICLLAMVLALAGMPVGAQQRTKLDINAETPEGALLQAIGLEQDAAKKVTLMEEFAAKHPGHAGTPWVQGQLTNVYLKANQFDKVLPVAEKLIAFDASDVEMAHAGLKAAEGKKDAELIIKWSGITAESAKKAAALKKPEDEDEVVYWKQRVDFAVQVQKYADYSLYAAALGETDPNKKILLMDALTQRNPQSEYLPALGDQYFTTYRQMNNLDKAIAVAEKAAAENKASEDMLVVATDYFFQKKDYDKALTYSAKATEVLKTKAAPQGVSEADWEKKKKTTTGVALWYAGMAHAIKGNWPQTDSVLREALPLLEDDLLKSHATMNLGLANLKMGESAKPTPNVAQIQAAYTYFRQCSAIKGPNQGTAANNVKVLAGKYRGLK